MTAYPDAEINLCQQIYRNPVCSDLAVTAALSADIGVVILQRGRPVGRWRSVRGSLCFFSIISTEPFAVVTRIDDALNATIVMARDNSWRRPGGSAAA